MKGLLPAKQNAKRLTILIGMLLLLWGLGSIRPTPVEAHAILVRSNPSADARLEHGPAQIDMWFSEPLEEKFSGARLFDSLGQEMAIDPARIDPADRTHMILPLPALEPGIYSVAWQTLSQADGHQWYGSFPMTILNVDGSLPEGATLPVTGPERGELPTPGEAVARWFVIFGGILLLGSALFRGLILRPDITAAGIEPPAQLSQSILWLGAAMVLIGSWVQLAIQAVGLGSLGLLPDMLVGTRAGLLALIRHGLILVGVAVDLSRLRQTSLRWLAPPVWAGLLLTLSLGSHAGAAAGRNWAMLIDFLHLIAAAAWLGGLVLLPVLIWQARRADQLNWAVFGPIIRRFSYLAGLAVFGLAVTGLLSSLVQIPTLADLWQTIYGRTLSLKLLLVGLTLLVALANNRLVHRAPESLAATRQTQLLPRLVTIEALLGLSVLLATAVLVQTPTPPKPVVAVAPPIVRPFNGTAKVGDLEVYILILPNQVGQNQFMVHLTPTDGSAPSEAQLVRLYFDYQDRELGRSQVDLEFDGEVMYQTSGAYLNQAGTWQISVYVRRRGLDDLLTDFEVKLDSPTPQVVSTSPWQNPLSTLPAEAAIAIPLMALGLSPFLWRAWLRRAKKELFPMAAGLGLLCLIVGVFLILRTVGLLPAG